MSDSVKPQEPDFVERTEEIPISPKLLPSQSIPTEIHKLPNKNYEKEQKASEEELQVMPVQLQQYEEDKEDEFAGHHPSLGDSNAFMKPANPVKSSELHVGFCEITRT
ncbi:hypothetical protein L1987_77166 [Smallanthus sonchifolius]|uniref:Uncharacterized protein n=1 Tax=Smallanthus sonchifolius TaxID=185202 RepID=A0ACB8Z984_9ASTR|nr:hypothetical protein L1987_77166 [Smallanthus sonchifolius]